MTSRERLLRTLRREPVDRVPVSTYELNPYNLSNFENKAPSYRRLMERIKQDTDVLYMWSWNPWRESSLWETHTEIQADGVQIIYSRLNTPLGDLTRTQKVYPQIHTIWETEHLLKSVEDIDKYLRVLPDLFILDERQIEKAKEEYRQIDDRLGEHGIIMADGGDPSAFVPSLFEFGLFTEMCFIYKDKILELIEAHKKPIYDKTKIDVQEKMGPLMRVWGPEYYTPPYLPPSYFDEMVVPSIEPMAKIMREGDMFLRVHSHGRVRAAIPSLIQAGANGLDPLEPIPDGDISLKEIKEQYGNQLILFGNMELKTLETAEPEEITALVKQQMLDAKDGGGYISMSTASPINEPLHPKTEQNYFAWLDAVHTYGVY